MFDTILVLILCAALAVGPRLILGHMTSWLSLTSKKQDLINSLEKANKTLVESVINVSAFSCQSVIFEADSRWSRMKPSHSGFSMHVVQKIPKHPVP